MKNKKVIIAIILSIGAVISLIYGITSGKPRTYAKRQAVQDSKNTQPQEKITPTKRRSAKTNFTSWGRNPFTLQKSSSKAPKGLTLEGIMWDKENPMAIIDDEVVKIGDKVSGNTVVDIKQDKVILSDGVNTFELRLN